MQILCGFADTCRQWRFDICECWECTGCPVCGPAMPVVERIGSGGVHTWEWDGVAWRLESCVEGPGGPEHMCQQEGPLEPGVYTARFCFGFGGPDAYPGDWIEDPVCMDVEFTYPVAGGIVEYLVNNSG